MSEGHTLNCNGMIYNNFTLPAIKDSIVLWSDDAKCLREDWPDSVPQQAKMLSLLTQEFYANYDFKFKQRGLLPNAQMSVKNNTKGIAK